MSDRVLVMDCLPKCAACIEHFMQRGPLMIEACASVGIEHGKSTATMLREFYEVEHQKHRRADAQPSRRRRSK